MSIIDRSAVERIPVETYPFSENPRRLPIGINNNPYLLLPPYTGNTDILLGSIEDDFPENPYQVYRSFFTELLNINVEEMYLADVIFLILALRIKGAGSEICLTYVCNCDEQKKLIGGKNTAPHDLGSAIVRAKPVDIPARVNLEGIDFEPLRFRHLANLLGTPSYTLGCFLYQNMAIDAPPLSRKDAVHYEQLAISFHNTWGLEPILTFDCPCGAEWEKFIPPGEFEPVIMSFLRSNRESSLAGAAERYLHEMASFLMIGEMAPFKSVAEVCDLPISLRTYWVEKLSQTYKDIKNKGKTGV